MKEKIAQLDVVQFHHKLPSVHPGEATIEYDSLEAKAVCSEQTFRSDASNKIVVFFTVPRSTFFIFPPPKTTKKPVLELPRKRALRAQASTIKNPPLRQPGCQLVARSFAPQSRPWFAFIGAVSDAYAGQASKKNELRSSKKIQKNVRLVR